MTDLSAEQCEFDFSEPLPPPTRAAIGDGMRRADQNADQDWKALADDCVVAAARRKAEITSDDVLDELDRIEYAPHTHNLSAIGPAMKRAARLGILTSTNRVERSARSVKHGIRHTVWQSNIFSRKETAA